MKIFISWSGARSRAIGDVLNDWIKCVLQAAKPWMSSRDIDRGALWFNEISDQLKDISVGIVCLSQENKNAPWILFETGALAKGLTSSRVCTFLIDLEPSDLSPPLSQFNHTKPDRTSMLLLVRTLNTCLGEYGLEETVLLQVFTTYWPQFEKNFAQALVDNPESVKSVPRPQEDILAEILDNTRLLQSMALRLENALPHAPTDSPVSKATLWEKYHRILEAYLRGDLTTAETNRWLRDTGNMGVSAADIVSMFHNEISRPTNLDTNPLSPSEDTKTQ